MILATPWMAGRFTEGVLTGAEPFGLSLQALLAIWVVVVLLVQAVVRFVSSYLLVGTSERMLAVLRTRLYDHLQSLPLAYFHGRRRGETLTLLVNDAAIVSIFVTGPLLGVLPKLLVLLGALFFIFRIDVLAGLMIMLAVPAFYLALKTLGRRIRPLSRERIDAYSSMFSMVEENLNLLPVIKSFTREPLESNRFAARNEVLMDASRRCFRVQSQVSPMIRFLAASGVHVLLWFAIESMEAGAMSTPDLVSLLLYGMLLTQPVSQFADLYGQVQSTRAATDRILELFRIEPEPMGEGGRELDRDEGRIQFVNVDYRYPDREALFHDLNLTIEPGETVAITGENGAGKSTLVHLLMRFMDPDNGRILVDGHDIRDVTLANLRRQIGMVSQQVLLLNASVRDNIAFAAPQADGASIREAARAAHALDFIAELPRGFDTLIGDQGIKLSGGQKQRLALADRVVTLADGRLA